MAVVRSFLMVLAVAAWMILPASAQARLDRLSIVTASGQHEFEVEVMRTSAEHERGLMFRRHLDPNRGMLFDFGTPQAVSMWMKNTYLPLDMVFIDATGKIVSIREHAEPLSEEIIPSGGEVTGTLELNAGTARRIGAKPGDIVQHPMFRN